jgi:hypothetical protein
MIDVILNMLGQGKTGSPNTAALTKRSDTFEPESKLARNPEARVISSIKWKIICRPVSYILKLGIRAS